MDYEDRIKRNSAVAKIVVLLIFAVAILLSLTSKKKLPPAAQEYFRNVTFKTVGGQYPETGWDAVAADDGGVVAAGDTRSSGNGGTDVYLVKVDKDGSLVWTRTFGGEKEDHGLSLENAYDGGYIVAGSTASSGHGETDIYIIKTDVSGEEIWSKTIGGGDYDYAYSIKRTFDGNYIVAGYTSGGNNSDGYLLKMDKKGKPLWQKVYGGAGWDLFYSAIPLKNGGYLACGYTTSYGAAKSSIYLVKTDAGGNSVWARTYGGKRENRGIYAVQDKDGGYILASKTTSYISKGVGWDVMLIKLDADGNSLWTSFVTAADLDVGKALLQDDDGAYMVTGTKKCYGICDSNVFLERVDASGNTKMFRIFAGPRDDSAASIINTKDGGYYICGSTLSNGNGMSDVMIMKVDKHGEQVW